MNASVLNGASDAILLCHTALRACLCWLISDDNSDYNDVDVDDDDDDDGDGDGMLQAHDQP